MNISGYFNKLFEFNYNDEDYGIKSISLKDGKYDYGKVNELFSDVNMFVDSFTYTPFVDYACAKNTDDSAYAGDLSQLTMNRNEGIYADEHLTKYNDGFYDVVGNFVDKNRHIMSSNLFQLGNLAKDLDDAKVSFREAIENTDSKTYIHVFCEHLFTLFARLSNIRMCHEFYELKQPHRKWEGVLALDIWYNMLYKEIDEKYAFDDALYGRNPMAKIEILTNDDGIICKKNE